MKSCEKVRAVSSQGSKRAQLAKAMANKLKMVELFKNKKEVKTWKDKFIKVGYKEYHVKGFSTDAKLKWISPKFKNDVILAKTSVGLLQTQLFDIKALEDNIDRAGLGWQTEEYPFLAGHAVKEINVFSGRLASVRYQDNARTVGLTRTDGSLVQLKGRRGSIASERLFFAETLVASESSRFLWKLLLGRNDRHARS